MTEAVQAEEIRREEELREELAGKKSLETYGVSYLIEAGAGAGKTYILVNRMINQLLSGVAKPEELAAITFTEKATQEMVERIDRELIDRLENAVKAWGHESAEAVRIRNLIEGIDQMQISTIHSFCRNMLTTMPFSSELGPEFEMADDPVPLADAFFEQQVREFPERFRKAREATGIGYDLLKESFRKVCESRGEIVFECLDDARLSQKIEEMQTLAGLLYAEVSEKGSIENHNKRSAKPSKAAEAILPKINEVLRLKDESKESFVLAVLDACNPCIPGKSIDPEAIARVLPGTIKENKQIVEDKWKAIAERWGEIMHSLSMELFCSLIPDYRNYKRQQKVATQQDLLNCARDMLKTDAEARQYFHQKYACVYVDEMQDTDPVQAQILFYLTTEESEFDPHDWRNCRPVPGSLFLVGDPKQAIYRFRGADITVYKTLETLFRDGVGRVEHLHFNFRSSSEITDFSDHMFKELLAGGDYQAAYSGMTAVAGASDHARILSYTTERDCDPDHVAAFIAEMVHVGALVGTKDHSHKATYEDFLILTNTNGRTEEYVKALSTYGIPCNMAGAKKYSEMPQLIRGNAVLQYLADSDDETKLAAALVICYGIPFTVLRSYRQMAGSLAANPNAVRTAMAEIGKETEYSEIFAGLEELSRFKEQAKSLPGITVLENIWKKSCAVWQEEKALEHVKEYPMVLQFLHELRNSGGSLTVLAAKAEDLLHGTADRELLLTEETNCVRIMNLHKAKGLESEIVILAFDSPFKTDAEKHIAFEGNTEYLHLCMSRANSFEGSTVYAKPSGWDDGPGKKEQEFLKAQIVRLLYVAATRAKTALIVCGAKKNTWTEIAMKCESEQEKDANWQKAINALECGKSTCSSTDQQEMGTTEANSARLEEQLKCNAGSLSSAQHLDISPSMMERRDELQTSSFVNDAFPHGAKWGTLMHRLLELCVRDRSFEKKQRKLLAVQATYETLDGEPLSEAEKRMLDPQSRYPEEETLFDALAETAVLQTDFLENPEHELKNLLDSGKCYAELPFEACLRKGDPLRELCSSMTEEPAEVPVELRGVIDLAIHREQDWVIVDYKTDARREGEASEAYIERLKMQYIPQILIYREIIRRLNLGDVRAAYLCALSLNGMLIEV